MTIRRPEDGVALGTNSLMDLGKDANMTWAKRRRFSAPSQITDRQGHA